MVAGLENTDFFVLLPAFHIILSLIVSFHQNSDRKFSKYFKPKYVHRAILHSSSQNAYFTVKFYTFKSLGNHLTMKELTSGLFLFLNSISEKKLIL